MSENQVVLITGASKGIGKSTAEYLKNKGYTVYGTSRNPSKLSETYEFPMLELDVNIDTSVESCVEQILEKEGKIDILVNNAGFTVVGPLADTSIDDMKMHFETNFFGIHRMVRAVLPILQKQSSGKIISMGSFAGRFGNAFQSLYSASKSALAMYSDALRVELFTSGVKVSLVEPGDIKTDFDDGRILAQDFKPEENEVAQRALEIMKKGEMNGASPIKVAKMVHKIIKSKRPKPRYTVGFDAKFFGTLNRLLPYTLQERVNMMYYKIPRKSK
ncbi:MAG: SDR family NAD(P)-dependent oxidoreductase [Candidatus Kariarchaeaceae archaeon]|jgi:short-subunit dehydrogenase